MKTEKPSPRRRAKEKKLETALEQIEKRRDALESTLEELRQELYELTTLPEREALVGQCFSYSHTPDGGTTAWTYMLVIGVPKDSRDVVNVARVRIDDANDSAHVDLCEPYPANMLVRAHAFDVKNGSRAEWKNALRRARAVLRKLR